MLPSGKLLPLFQEITSYLKQLLNALNSEHQALSKNNFQSIDIIAKEKIVLMEQLEDLNKERLDLLNAAGFDASTESVEEFLKKTNSPRTPLVQSSWKEISNLTDKCEKQNDINGIVIENNRQHTENALSILQGKQQSTELYTNKGAPIKTTKTPTLIRA